MFEKRNSEKIMVSIIIPVYNIEKYVEKCLNSLKRQTYDNFEAIIVDDGSSDDTRDICEKIAQDDKRFKIFHKKNEGVSIARNFGLLKAEGVYICFVDGDDYVEPDYLKILVRCLQKDDIDMGCSDYFIERQNQIIVHSQKIKEPVYLSKSEAINKLGNKQLYQGYLWNKIFKKEIIERYQLLFDSRIKVWEDMLFCVRYLSFVHKVCYIQLPIYFYVQRQGSAMANTSIWEEHTHLYALEQMWNIVEEYEGDFKEYIRNFYANDLAGCLGKKNFTGEKQIYNYIDKIEQLRGKLSFKHKVKVFMFKYFFKLIMKRYNR